MHRRLRKTKSLFVCILLTTFLGGCGKSDVLELDVVEDLEISEIKAMEAEELEQEALFVYICGAVKNPGLYELPNKSRIYNAITYAGGLTEEAAPSFLNQAEVLYDGQKIYVPTIQEVENTSQETFLNEEEKGKININTASKEELMTLVGIGEKKAQSILDYREKHGGFSCVEDIMSIEGIKGATYEKIQEDITI